MKQPYTLKKACLVLFSGLLISAVIMNDSPLEKIVTGFGRYLSELPQEKVYMHLDRPYYTAGETIWFKAYLTVGPDHVPSVLSKTLHVELINETGQPIHHQVLLILNGSAAGDILLPDSLKSGNYTARAYTNWMKNNHPDYFFHRLVKVWGFENPVSENVNQNHVDFKLFPEGGNLVEGLPSQVAFKAIGPDGLGRIVKGKVLANNEVISELKSNSLGMGSVYLTPQKGKQYKVIIEEPSLEVAFPTVQSSGLAISIINTPKLNDLSLKIFKNSEIKSIYLLGQTRGIVCYSARIELTTNMAVVKIPKAKFPSGIAQISVIDPNGDPIAERLTFIQHNDQLRLKIISNKDIYSPREMVTLDIQANDATGKPVVADLSLAVCDDQQVLLDNDAETLQSYLLLSSELRGYIESPGYYFNILNRDRDEALEHLLLTQGWRRFTITQAKKEKWEIPQFVIERGLTIKGKLLDKYNNNPIVAGEVSMLNSHSLPEARTAITNTKGEFEFKDIIYFDSTNVLLQGQTKRGSKAVKIELDNTFGFQSELHSINQLSQNQTEFEKRFIQKSAERKNIDRAFKFDPDAVTLNDIHIVAKRENRHLEGSRSFGRGTAQLKVADNPGLENLLHPLQLVQGRVAGVQVSGSGSEWKVQIQGVTSIYAGTNPLIMIDDIPVDIEMLSTLPVHDIESFVVWKGADAAIFGARGTNGAIGFYTKRGSNAYRPTTSGFTYPSMGFSIEREFYAPRYDVKKPEHIKPDKRVTLFWAPRIQTDSTGQAHISFFTNDEETTITGVIEGISLDGAAGSSRFSYSIKLK